MLLSLAWIYMIFKKMNCFKLENDFFFKKRKRIALMVCLNHKRKWEKRKSNERKWKERVSENWNNFLIVCIRATEKKKKLKSKRKVRCIFPQWQK
jgi:hypothetical protein